MFGIKHDAILKDKNLLVDSYIRYMLSRTLRMFEYTGLPETIPQRELELILQLCKVAIFTKVNDDLFVFYGGLGGVPNEYYQPTQAIVTNPYLKFSKVLDLDDYIKNDGNAVIGWSDSAHIGLYPMFTKYASLIAETDITIKYSLINMRFMNILTADDDNQKESLEKMFADVENGTGFGIIVTKRFMKESSVGSMETQPSRINAQLKDLIETKQYLIGSWYNDLGLNANFNMKREAINESEADMNEDSLLPLIDDMLERRKQMCEDINRKFGTNISVELSSSWKQIRKEIVLREEEQESPIGDVQIDEEPKVDDVQPE